MSHQSPEAQSKFASKCKEDADRLKVWLKGLKALNASIDEDISEVLAGTLKNPSKTYKSYENTADTFIRCLELHFDKKLTAFGDLVDDVFERTQSDDEFIVADEEVESSDYEPSESEGEEDSDFIASEEEAE